MSTYNIVSLLRNKQNYPCIIIKCHQTPTVSVLLKLLLPLQKFRWLMMQILHPKESERNANSEDSDWTSLRSALFVLTNMSENFGAMSFLQSCSCTAV